MEDLVNREATSGSCDLDSSSIFKEDKREFRHLGDISDMKVARPLRLLTMNDKKTPSKFN
jgi:hypothetical protein